MQLQSLNPGRFLLFREMLKAFVRMTEKGTSDEKAFDKNELNEPVDGETNGSACTEAL